MKAQIINDKQKGFTLLELLTVITVIGILATLMFPVVKRMQEAANRVVCMNNLSQIGRSLAIYSMDNNDTYPSNLVGLAKYLEEAEMLKCKSDRWRTVGGFSNITAGTADKYCSYNMVVKSTDGSLASASSPSSMLLVCDKDGDNNNVTRNGFGGNHRREGGHVLLNNGSVRWMTAETWTTNTLGGADLNSVVGY